MSTQESIIDDHRRLTRAELDDLVGRAVGAIDAVGLGADRRLAVMGENGADTVVAHLGALSAGVSSVPVPRYLGADEVAYILRDSGAGALLSGPGTAEVAAKAAAEAGVAHLSFDAWLATAAPAPPAADRPARTLLVYTSGTTGRPKGTDMRWLRTLPATVGEHLAQLAAGSPFPPGPHLVVGPLHHTGPLSALRHALAGGTVVILARFDPGAVLGAIEEHRVESSVMVPTHFSRLLALQAERRKGSDVSSLRRVIHTGAACPADVKRAMIDWWGPVLSEAYGGSESGTVCAIESDEWLARPGSVGRPVAGFEALVLDEQRRPLPPGEEGALWLRDLSGRGVRYHGRPAEPPDPALFTLGEIGRIDADGYVYITDRQSDMVVSGGVNLYPAEAEAALARHPAVADVAVIGVPDQRWGEAVKAVVVKKPGAEVTVAQLIEFARQRIAGYKVPRSVDFVASLPRNPTGKILKRELREPYWAKEERRVN
jgi:long-chain acyl-CoA synthetase